MKFGSDSFDSSGLEDVIKLLKKSKLNIKIGILGGDSDRTEENDSEDSKEVKEYPDNATIGMWHELGNEHLPSRSWLRMPLSTMLAKKLKASGAFDKKTMDEVLKEKSFEKYAKKIGIAGEECIQEAFDTGGFGKWKPSDMSGKKNEQTLVETQQLRNSVTSEVTKL